ncbi:MAG: hypothetical protein WA655_09725 [Candidatus Korobacteraceae bacterium]
MPAPVKSTTDDRRQQQAKPNYPPREDTPYFSSRNLVGILHGCDTVPR